MHTTDFLELKDTASECSMDSAYQSLSGASRHGARKLDGQNLESRTRIRNQFSSDIYSPSLSTDSYTAFPDQALDICQMPHPSITGPWEAPEGNADYANYSAGQDLTQYTAANLPRFTPSWVAVDSQFQSNSFAYTSYPAGETSHEMMFEAAAPSQQQWSVSFDSSERPAAVRSSSSYTIQQDSQRASVHDPNFGAFVETPTSTTSIHFPQNGEFDPSSLLSSRNDNEDSASASLPQSLDENDDILSQSESADTKLEEERTKVARSHPLYQRQPDKDGKYHCPEEGQTGCSHKPTPLKCNYDKYVDSHLKPFRCNKKSCVGVQFSSTACLLRHEREAHGMHGHGARPHLCHFRDCERAVPGHGFPRRYNLFDHMKRVHQFEGPTTEPSPPTMQGQAQRKPASRKRKVSTEDVSEKRQKAAKLSAEQEREQQRDALTQEFLSKRNYIIDILNGLSGPSDLSDGNQLTKEALGLHDICTKYRDVSGG